MTDHNYKSDLHKNYIVLVKQFLDKNKVMAKYWRSIAIELSTNI